MASSSSQESAVRELDDVLKELTGTPIGRRAFLASLPLLMASCATSVEQTRYREGDNSGQNTELTPDDERRMTQEALLEMRKDYPPVQDPALQSYVTTLGSRLVAANSLAGKPYYYNFTVVDVKNVNAFALPAGTIFVTAPLVAMAETEAELAGVIGHEIGHVKARHTAERMEQMRRAQGKTWIYAIGGGLLGGAAGFGLGKLLCPPRNKKCLSQAAQIGAVAGAGGGLLVQKYGFMANSREDEMEADRIGFRTAVQAGFSKEHVGSFYTKLLKMEEDRERNNVPVLASLADAMSTHPPSRERVAQMQTMAAETPGNPRAAVSSSAFEQAKKRAAQMGKVQG